MFHSNGPGKGLDKGFFSGIHIKYNVKKTLAAVLFADEKKSLEKSENIYKRKMFRIF
jgi:hypothetical protein